MAKQTDQKIKAQALALFLNGWTLTDIAEQVGVKQTTVSLWKLRGDWDSLKTAVVVKSQGMLTEETSKILTEDTKRQLEYYRRLQEKGVSELDLKAARTAGEAGSLVDVGIKGEREVAKGLISYKLISEIAHIISEEVQDEDTKKRIAAKIKGLLLGG